jgi:hypothetical protein
MKYLAHFSPLKPKGKEETKINSIHCFPSFCLLSNYTFWLQTI